MTSKRRGCFAGRFRANRVYVRDEPWWVADCLGGVVTTAVRWAASLGETRS